VSSSQEDWLERSNAETLYHLERQGRTGLGLVPFLGAGISTPFNFKDWPTLLRDAAPPRLAPRIKRQLDEKNYEGAAETLLKELEEDGFQNMVAAAAGDSNLESFNFRSGTLSLLPLLTSGPVITTNFDRLLERAFEANGAPFETVISGPRPDLIVDALHGNRRVLIKLHGDWQDRVGRTFAKSDYDANYGKAQPERKRELLAGAEGLLFSSRSLLFIGASLGPDRTVEVLQEIHERHAGIRHFAIMSVPDNERVFEKKERHLRSCGVLPLWYRAKTGQEHTCRVEELVNRVIERLSVRTVKSAFVETSHAPLTPAPMGSSKRRLRHLEPHLKQVTRLIHEGRLTFFLGSAIHHPTRFRAKEFYEKLASVFECEALKDDLYAVAQYIADRYGRENLYAEIRRLFAQTPFEPRATHELFAAWGKYRTDFGKEVPFPTVITTNYDDLLERRLAQARVPYHLLSYQGDPPHSGLFYHRSPDNALRIIERPDNIREFAGGIVLVKLNGGLDRQRRIPESYVTTRVDFWDLAARIPSVFPAGLRKTISENPLLFLGHGLAVPDVESLVRFAHKGRPQARSWAVALRMRQALEYWRQCGVEIISEDINLYVNELRKRLGASEGVGL
jgi:hypothetical protein